MYEADIYAENLYYSINDAFAAGMSVINRETWAAFGDLVSSGKLGLMLKSVSRLHAQETDADIAEAELVRSSFIAEVDHLLNQVDLLVLPTSARFSNVIE